jgi:UDP-glucose 4-epimerase
LHSAALIDYAPGQTRFLHFGRVLDTTRLRTEFGYLPRWTSSQAFDDFARSAALHPTVDPR